MRVRKQRGFSLIVVMLLLVVMVGAAATLLMTTAGQLQVSGQDRQQAVAFYAAEYAVARAKAYIASRSADYGGNWNGFLTNGANTNVLCAAGANTGVPGTTLKATGTEL